MKPLPFKMRTETPMEKYRAETFWTKEPETIAWIESFSPHDVFFDVGANVGVYSLYAASLFPEISIYAFEPMPGNFDSFTDNVRINGFRSIFSVWMAVGSQPTSVAKFYTERNESGYSGGQVGKVGEDILMCGIDYLREYEYHGQHIFDFPNPTHIKIDIDGQELEVVKGMMKTLPVIKSALIEVSKASKEPIMEIMLKAGFTTDNRFNTMTPHSRERRAAEGIDAENIVFMRHP